MADKALLLVGTKRHLAAQLEMSPTTITNFFAGRPVDRQKFLKICQVLKLKWQDVIEQVAPTSSNEDGIESLVRQLRQQIQPYIQNRCGTMRVLNMTQPIGLGEIYTDVNILEKLTANRRLELEELLAACQIENGADFDRFGLSRATEKRKPGLEVVQQYKHLMVLGRPGAGKTTFLKHLAIECISGNHFADRVPLFVTLKEFAETDNQPDLVNFLATLLPHPALTQLLSAGKALLLLDGLDEVKETDIRRVNQQIRLFAEHFHQNQIVVTCRIAAKSYIFEQFVEVEVADFNPEQIEIFVRKWFQAKQPQKADWFLEHLKEHQPIQELANNPLLLTLLCLIFEEKNKFKESRVDLYSEGVDLLLEKWDDSRDIDRDQIYKTLSIRRRIDLLSKLALATFETGNYFFRRREAEHQICEYIRNLPGIENTPEALDINSKKILRSIEAQHGLLTERAVDIYSFSHLTFHEYFAALEIAQSNRFDLLLNNLTKKRWHEVILLIASILRSSDELVKGMKQKVDELLAEDRELQELLALVQQKTSTTNVLYKPAEIRACCLMLFSTLLRFPLKSGLSIHDIYPSFRDIRPICSNIKMVCQMIEGATSQMLEENGSFSVHDSASRIRKYINILQVELYRFSTELLELPINVDLQKSSLDAVDQFLFSDNEALKKYFGYEISAEQYFRKILIAFGNANGLNLSQKFAEEQKQLLQQYFDASLLLAECLNLQSVYISYDVRKDIEAALLLPIIAIQDRENELPNRSKLRGT